MAGMGPLGILNISNKTPNDARTPLGGTMSHILLLTNSTGTSVDVLPALELLNHRVHILPAEPTALLETDPCDIPSPSCSKPPASAPR